jgi:prophage DNA circulation protein
MRGASAATPADGGLEAALAALSTLTGDARAVLSSLGGALSHVTRITEPIQTQAEALMAAQANIDAAKAGADKLLQALDRVAQARRRSEPALREPGRVGWRDWGAPVSAQLLLLLRRRQQEHVHARGPLLTTPPPSPFLPCAAATTP